jgi:hypothetical protein
VAQPARVSTETAARAEMESNEDLFICIPSLLSIDLGDPPNRPMAELGSMFA